VWKETFNTETNTSQAEWVYVSEEEAVKSMGSI
jgi:hypothetical protein